MAIRASRLHLLFATVVLTTLVFASTVRAEPPRPTSATDELRRHFDQVLATAQSPSFRALDLDRRREEIRRISNRLFNWSEMSRRALGSPWRELSATERRAFSAWFASLAERAYMGQVEQLAGRGVPRDPVRYLGETANGGETVVRTALMYPRDLPIDFLMNRRAGRWEVCDVRVDGVSASANYEAQFRRVIAQTSFAGLVDRMHEKASQSDGATPAAAARP